MLLTLSDRPTTYQSSSPVDTFRPFLRLQMTSTWTSHV